MAVTNPVYPSLGKYGGGTALPAAVTRRCTALTMVVYTGCTGAHALLCCSWPSPGGYRPRGGCATEQDGGAPPEHLTLGLLTRSLPQGWWCTVQGMVVPPWQHPEHGNASFSLPLLPPLQMCQHHKCFTITCKCVSIFTIIFQRLIASHRLCTRPKMHMQVF